MKFRIRKKIVEANGYYIISPEKIKYLNELLETEDLRIDLKEMIESTIEDNDKTLKELSRYPERIVFNDETVQITTISGKINVPYPTWIIVSDDEKDIYPVNVSIFNDYWEYLFLE